MDPGRASSCCELFWGPISPPFLSASLLDAGGSLFVPLPVLLVFRFLTFLIITVLLILSLTLSFLPFDTVLLIVSFVNLLCPLSFLLLFLSSLLLFRARSTPPAAAPSHPLAMLAVLFAQLVPGVVLFVNLFFDVVLSRSFDPFVDGSYYEWNRWDRLLRILLYAIPLLQLVDFLLAFRLNFSLVVAIVQIIVAILLVFIGLFTFLTTPAVVIVGVCLIPGPVFIFLFSRLNTSPAFDEYKQRPQETV